MSSATFQLQSIGVIESPFKEKFAVPRQPGLVNATGIVRIYDEFADPRAFAGIEQFSHLWLHFIFHHNPQDKWSPSVRPPRLGGNTQIGVFATRSPFRPNRLGLSVVEFVEVVDDHKGFGLKIRGLDLVDGTPIVDIKPYVAYSDAIANARAGFAQDKPKPPLSIEFTASAKQQLRFAAARYPELEMLIRGVLAQDPRPAYKKDKQDSKIYGVHLYEFNVCWQVENDCCTIISISPFSEDTEANRK